jgi:hypothetical protein
MPEPLASLPPELMILAWVALMAGVVGVPLIQRGIHLPRDLEFHTPDDGELTDAQRAHFQRLDEGAAAIGYAPLLNFEVPNLQGANLTRVYRSDCDPAILGASCLRAHDAGGGTLTIGANALEWITKHRDGTTLTTRNADVGELFDLMPHQVRQECPALSDLAQLKQRHDRAAEALRVREPCFAHGTDVLDEYRDHHRRWCAFQESRGLLRFDPQAGRYRATAKLAWRGVAHFLNPLADNFTLSRFLSGALLGAGLPVAALLLLGDAARARALADALGIDPDLCRWVARGAACTAGGAAVGWLFTSKCFVWALVLGYLPLRLMGLSPGLHLLWALWMGLVAEYVAGRRHRRELLV